jgi:flagellar basal-body rod modification protein FlgD
VIAPAISANVPSAPAASAGGLTRQPSSVLGKDEFLKLLVAQLKNQDPTNPMDGQQMAAQLAQFSSVEQLIAVNQKLDAQAQSDAATAQAIANSSAISAIGKTVTSVGNELELVPGGDARIRAVVQGTGRGTLSLLDASGNVIGRRDLGTVRPGDQQFSLGGLELGQPAGVYRWQVDVTTADGSAIPVTPLMTGRVTGVEYGSNGARLVAGRLRIPVGTVVSLGSP